MTVTLKAGQYGWDYLLVFSDGTDYLVQSDREYPAAARLFGWDDSEDNYTDAQEYLDNHLDETAEIDGAADENYFYQRSQPSIRAADILRAQMSERVELTERDVEFNIETAPEDDLDYRRDFESDPETVQWIEDQLRSGNEWAWCAVTVTAKWNEFVGRDTLNACSYLGKQDFIENSGYYEDMLSEALADLNRKVAASGRLRPAQGVTVTGVSPLKLTFKPNGVQIEAVMAKREKERYLGGIPEEEALRLLFENSETNNVFCRIRPEEIGAMTEAPMYALRQDYVQDHNGILLRVNVVYVWDRYQVDSLVEGILGEGGAFLKRHVINWRIGTGGRTGEVVKDAGLPIEGEWEKDER